MKHTNASLKLNYVEKQKHILVKQNKARERQEYKSTHLEEFANMRLPPEYLFIVHSRSYSYILQVDMICLRLINVFGLPV
jgi:hypothetical protein